MIKPQIPENEDQRLKALEAYQILDTLPEDLYDDITKIASQICGTPIALVSLIDNTRQWFKSHHGLDVSETDKDLAYCAHAINKPDEILEVPDAFDDERFHDNPLAIGFPNVRFYAGAPLTDHNGYTLGTLCVIDHKERKLDKAQKETLWALSRQVVALLELRKENYQRKQADEAFTDLVENLGDGVFELDNEGKCTYTNSTMLKLLNLELDEVSGASLWDFIYQEDVDAMRAFYAEQFRKKAANCYYEYRLAPKNGEPIWIGQTTTMQYEGKKMVRLRTIARDLSENKSLKKRLQINESLFRLVSENSRDLIALHEPDGTYKFVSQSSKELVGFEPSEMIGKDPYSFIHADDIVRLRKGAHESTLQGESIEKVEYRMKRKDGSYIWLESYTKPILNELKEVGSFQTSSRDISERREEREQLKTAKIRAEEASDAKANFLSMMSHEIRTPLNGIIGTTHLLLNKEPNSNQLAHLNILRQSGDNLHAIVNDILDFNKIEEGKVVIEKVGFNLYEVANLIYKNYQIPASEKRIELTFDFDDALSQSYIGDSVRISQVLHNLVSNAIKFTDDGGVTLSLQRSNKHDNFDEILFVVKDTGIGIPEEKRTEIFNRFVQAEKSTTRRYGGSGLGLSITKNLVELMESTIYLDGNERKGTKFYFSLALQRAETKVRLRKSTQQGQKVEGLQATILIVEDNKFNMAIARDFLKSWKCKVQEATNGKEALAILESKEVDLVLLDLQMPVMDGFETIQEIRKRKDRYFKELPVIALTAAAMGDTKEKVFQMGMNDFISKPFLPVEFYNKLSAQLGKSEKHLDYHNLSTELRLNLEETLGGEDETIDEYLELFEETMSEEAEVLDTAIRAVDIPSIRAYAHKIKSTVKLVGLEEMAREAEEMETMIDQKNPDAMIVNKAKAHYTSVKRIIDQLEHKIDGKI